jgi:hypothetical protein
MVQFGKGEIFSKNNTKNFLNFCFFEEKKTFTSFEVFQEYTPSHIVYCGKHDSVFSLKKQKFQILFVKYF